MVILVLIGICLVAGCLLYLPFFIWFRRRRRGAPVAVGSFRFTRVGVVFVFAQVVVQFGGLAFGVLAPESMLGSLTQGWIGFLRWSVFLIAVFSILAMLLRRAGIQLEHPKTAEDQAASIERRRGLKIATVRGVPVFVHWSLPIGGLVIASIANAGPAAFVSYCLTFSALIAIHEFAHFAVARALGLKVFAIEISGLGGICRIQLPRSARDTVLVYSAGLAAQVALLLLTLVAIAVSGAPSSPVGTSIVITFTWVNAFLIVVNLIPAKTRDGLSTDGDVLWKLFLHVFKGRPHPLAELHAASPLFPPETRLLTIDGLLPPGFTTGIEMLNDDTTPMEFVIEMLQKHLKLEREAAVATMLGVHTRGGLLLPVEDHERAEQISQAIATESRERGHQLICRAVRLTPF